MTLLLLLATSCCPAVTIGKLDKLPQVKERPVEVQCCFVSVGDRWIMVPESVALKYFNPLARFYFMDGYSWGNVLKVSAERDGRIKEYEQFPCVR